jgi:two-component system response regulator VicR
MYKILIIDTDFENVNMMEHFLRREGYKVLTAFTVRDAVLHLEKNTPDLCIIDTTAPGLDGLGLCRKIRATAHTANLPVLLTGQDVHFSVTSALEAGGDDYISKPFALREVAARMRAHLRRVSGNLNDGMPMLRILPETQTIFINDREVILTQVEFELITFLCRKPNQLHRTEDLLTGVWQYPRGAGDAALVRNHVRNLRRKIEDDPERPSIIQSRHGRGYAIRASIRIEGAVAFTS